MTIHLFRLPLLVYDCIVKQMDLPETFTLSTTSKKAYAITKACLTKQKCELNYAIGERFAFTYGGAETDFIAIKGFRRFQPISFKNWKVSNQEIVRVTIRNNRVKRTWIDIHWDEDKWKVLDALLLHAISLFPNLSLMLIVKTVDGFRNTMALVKDVRDRKISVEGEIQQKINDDLVRLALDECRNTRSLWISCKASHSFEYAALPPPFKNNYLVVGSAGWVTRDHMVELFLGSKAVELEEKGFDDEDLSVIFAKWIEDSSTNYLSLSSNERPYRGRSLANVVGHLPGAQVVRKAKIRTDGSEFKVFGFRDGRCYLLQQHGGGRALVYQYDQFIVLTIHFQIGEQVDGMQVELQEQEEE